MGPPYPSGSGRATLAPYGARVRRALERTTWTGTLLVGLAGSSLIAVAALFVGRIAPTPGAAALVALARWPVHRTVGYSLAILGLVLLTGAWLVLRRHLRGREGVHRGVLTAFAWAAPMLLPPPLFSGDVWSYVANGMIVARDLSPYVVTPVHLSGPIVHAVSARWIHSPAPYGPLPLVLGGGISDLTRSPWLALYGYRLLALVALAALGSVLPALARAGGRDPAAAVWLGVASPFTLVYGVVSPHVDLWIAAFSAAALLAAVRSRAVLATVLVGAATAVKVPALLVAVPVALALLYGPPRPGWRAQTARTAAVAAGAGVTVWALGLASGLGLGWVHGLAAPLSSRTPLSLSTEVGVRLHRLLGEPTLASTRDAALALLAVVAAVVVLRRSAARPGDATRAGAAVMAAGVVLSPIVHYWYLFWPLPFLAAAPLKPGPRRMATSMTAVLGLLAPFDVGERLPDTRSIMFAGVLAALATAVDVRRVRPWVERQASRARRSRSGVR